MKFAIIIQSGLVVKNTNEKYKKIMFLAKKKERKTRNFKS
jgi:hypothetical protein